MTTFREVTPEDKKGYGLFLLIYVAVVIVSATFLLPQRWYFLLAIVVIGGLVMVGVSTTGYGARCANCDNEFELSFIQELFAPHGGYRSSGAWQYVRCPKCGIRTKATVVKKVV